MGAARKGGEGETTNGRLVTISPDVIFIKSHGMSCMSGMEEHVANSGLKVTFTD